MRISDWSSDVCSSDLGEFGPWKDAAPALATIRTGKQGVFSDAGLGGESHHAIIPNPKTRDTLPAVYDALSADERRLFDVIARLRSDERRVGKECVSTCRYRWWHYHKKKKRKRI